MKSQRRFRVGLPATLAWVTFTLLSLNIRGEIVAPTSAGIGVAHHHAHHMAQLMMMASMQNALGSVMNYNAAMKSAAQNPFDDYRRNDLQAASNQLNTSMKMLNADIGSGSIDASQIPAVQAGMAQNLDPSLSLGNTPGAAPTTPTAAAPAGGTQAAANGSAAGLADQSAAQPSTPSGPSAGMDGTTILDSIPQGAGAGVPGAGGVGGTSIALYGGAGSPAPQTGNSLDGAALGQAQGESANPVQAGRDTVTDGPGTGADGANADPENALTTVEASDPIAGSLSELQMALSDDPSKGKSPSPGALKKGPAKLTLVAGLPSKKSAKRSLSAPATKHGYVSSIPVVGAPLASAMGESEDGGDDAGSATPWQRFLWIFSIVVNLTLFTFKGIPWLMRRRRDQQQAERFEEEIAPEPPNRVYWIR